MNISRYGLSIWFQRVEFDAFLTSTHFQPSRTSNFMVSIETSLPMKGRANLKIFQAINCPEQLLFVSALSPQCMGQYKDSSPELLLVLGTNRNFY